MLCSGVYTYSYVRTCPVDIIAAERFPPLEIVAATSTNL